MRTILLLNNLIRAWFGLVLQLAICHAAYAGTSHDWNVLIGKQAVVKIDGKQVRIERSLQARLRRAEAASFLPLELASGPANSWRWLLLREASRARGDASFCGAGHEDHLLLIKITKPVGVVMDDFLAQSCLKSISMDIDQFNELIDAISIDETARQLSLQQSISGETDSFRQEVRLEVVSGRVKVSKRTLAD